MKRIPMVIDDSDDNHHYNDGDNKDDYYNECRYMMIAIVAMPEDALNVIT